MERVFHQITAELGVRFSQVKAVVNLLSDGATVPFIARYRKEATGALNDAQLRDIEERLHYLSELEARKETILKSIQEQGKLTQELERSIKEATKKTILEDLYLPYRPKRRTKGQIAIEAGLEPLANTLYETPDAIPEHTAEHYIDQEKGIEDVKAALEGAKYVLIERFSESAVLVGEVRAYLQKEAWLNSRVIEGKQEKANKFSDYFEYSGLMNAMPSHRVLAILRGQKEGYLKLSLTLGPKREHVKEDVHLCEIMIAKVWNIEHQGRPADDWLASVVRWTWRVKLLPHMETDLIGCMRQNAEKQAIQVFANNLKDLLLAAPAGAKVTMGLDPGLRTGTKVAIVDGTGKLLDHATIYPHAPQNRTVEAQGLLIKLILKHNVDFIAIGNGTASRETDRLIGDLLRQFSNITVRKVLVSEAGASVYSASKLASEEFPDLDVVFRGAVSIARRLQDPLAELVKIEPKSIGVGQYQHDVNQVQLARSLKCVVEDCVNAVGVDVNTASGTLLKYVAGLNGTLADNIVTWRNVNGPFKEREQLMKVERLGNKSYEQSAGFLRIVGGDNPIDCSAVHPESYPVVQRIMTFGQRDIRSLMGNTDFLDSLNAKQFIDEHYGLPTVVDIIAELKKPGRDPRPQFKTVQFKENVAALEDLKPGMILEGVVSNVTNFGAFVDVGVHQDGLVHISSLCNRFVKNPRDIVKTGDIVKVKVLEIECARRRLSLTMRFDEHKFEAAQPAKKPPFKKNTMVPRKKNTLPRKTVAPSRGHRARKPDKVMTPIAKKEGTFAELFANAKKLRK